MKQSEITSLLFSKKGERFYGYFTFKRPEQLAASLSEKCARIFKNKVFKITENFSLHFLSHTYKGDENTIEDYCLVGEYFGFYYLLGYNTFKVYESGKSPMLFYKNDWAFGIFDLMTSKNFEEPKISGWQRKWKSSDSIFIGLENVEDAISKSIKEKNAQCSILPMLNAHTKNGIFKVPKGYQNILEATHETGNSEYIPNDLHTIQFTSKSAFDISKYWNLEEIQIIANKSVFLKFPNLLPYCFDDTMKDELTTLLKTGQPQTNLFLPHDMSQEILDDVILGNRDSWEQIKKEVVDNDSEKNIVDLEYVMRYKRNDTYWLFDVRQTIDDIFVTGFKQVQKKTTMKEITYFE